MGIFARDAALIAPLRHSHIANVLCRQRSYPVNGLVNTRGFSGEKADIGHAGYICVALAGRVTPPKTCLTGYGFCMSGQKATSFRLAREINYPLISGRPSRFGVAKALIESPVARMNAHISNPDLIGSGLYLSISAQPAQNPDLHSW